MPTTLLDFVSQVLIKIGESTVDTVDRNEASRLAAQNTVVAIRALADSYSFWSWSHSEYNAESWVNNVATLPEGLINISYIKDVNAGNKILMYVPERIFERWPEPLPYTGTVGGAEYYTLRGGKPHLHPYPNDEDSRNSIIFNAAVIPSLGNLTDNDVIPLAERDLNCLLFRVCMMMAVDHLRDTALTQIYTIEYETALRAAKQRVVTDSSDSRRSMIW